MHVSRGYRDHERMAGDHNVYTHPDVSGLDLKPVTRVIPDCGYTYFLDGHVPVGSPLIQNRCRDAMNRCKVC